MSRGLGDVYKRQPSNYQVTAGFQDAIYGLEWEKGGGSKWLMVRLFRNMIETDMPKIERGKRERDRDGERQRY